VTCYSAAVDQFRHWFDTCAVALLEREAFESFYLATSAWLVRALRPVVDSDAEDIAQDAFLTLFQRWDAVSRYDSPEAWLRRVALRAAVRHRQRTTARPQLELLGALLRDGFASDEPTCVMLREALQPLSASDREALVLRHLADWPVKALAERFACSEASMRVRLHRASRRAHEHLMGLSGTWTMDATVTRRRLETVLRGGGQEAWLGPVMDNLAELGDFRTQLSLDGGHFRLTSGPDEHLDHGRYALTRDGLRLDSAGFPGGVFYRLHLQGDSLTLRQYENRNPMIHGAPDDAFQLALVGSSPFSWHPVAS
jgi:RNA polymerase sigma factor (sigma-70 family)